MLKDGKDLLKIINKKKILKIKRFMDILFKNYLKSNETIFEIIFKISMVPKKIKNELDMNKQF